MRAHAVAFVQFGLKSNTRVAPGRNAELLSVSRFWVLNTDVLAIAMHEEAEVLHVSVSNYDPELAGRAGNDDCA